MFQILLFQVLWSFCAAESAVKVLLIVGCFDLPANETELGLNYTLPGIKGDSAVKCVASCQAQQFRYAGVVNASECKCGVILRGNPSNDCNKNCYPDTSHFCGGEKGISVYETGSSVPGPPVKFRLLESTSSGIHLSWGPPIITGSSPISLYQISTTAIETKSGLEPPGLGTWEFSNTSTSAWLYGVHPATFYSIEIRAGNTAGLGASATTEGWTKISAPPIPMQPEVLSRTSSTMTVKLHHVSPSFGPITYYQIVVVDETVGVIMNTDALYHYFNATKEQLPYYIAAQFKAEDFDTVFTVGDGKTYGGYYNAPLKPDIDYHILLGAVSVLNQTLASYSPSDHGQHTSSVFDGGSLSKHEFPPIYTRSNQVADKVPNHSHSVQSHSHHHKQSALVLGLSISVGILGCLVLVAVVFYIGLRVYLKPPRHSDHQELTVNSYDNGELTADAMGHFVGDDEDLPDHYSRLKQKVAVMAPANLTIVGDVGQGSFGAVRKGNIRSSSQVHSSNQCVTSVLVHHVLDDSLDTSSKAAMLRCLGQHVTVGQHKHIVALLGLVEEVAAVSLVFEYHTQTLKQQLTDARALTHYPVYAEKHRRFSTITEQQVLSILCGVARGLQWLRCCGVAHGAICARNVVLVDGTVPKLTGFGLLGYQNELYVPDYRRWMARELLSHMRNIQDTDRGGPNMLSVPCSLQGDVWSFGVLVWECVTLGGTPYPELRCEDITPRVQTGLRPPQPQYVGHDLYQVMLDCWQLDPGERPGLPQIEATLNQLSGEGSHLLFATYAGFQYQLFAPHLEFMD